MAWDERASPRVDDAVADLSPRGIRCLVGGDGTDHVRELPASGCVVKSPGVPPDAPIVREATDRGLLVIDEAELGWRLDSRPLIGVTGTNGKSTVCALVAAVLSDAGHPSVVAGNTAFGPPLSALGAADVVVAELSSFQLAGSPTLLPDAAVFTNLSDDHWEHHGGREAYAAAKTRMFVRGDRCVPVAALNVDDPLGADLVMRIERLGGRPVTFGRADGAVRVVAERWWLTGSEIRLDVEGERVSLETRLPGPHNAMNVAAAVALTSALGLDLDRAAHAIARTEPVAGRFEVLDEGQPFHAVVDYAHNPAGIGAVLATVRGSEDVVPLGRVIVVTSALAVLDDRQHRAAAAALTGVDEVVVSVERFSPADSHEPPRGFVDGLAEASVPTTVVPDRREAIRRAVAVARAGDMVLVLNRGARRSPSLDDADRPYVVDDSDETRAAIAELASR